MVSLSVFSSHDQQGLLVAAESLYLLIINQKQERKLNVVYVFMVHGRLLSGTVVAWNFYLRFHLLQQSAIVTRSWPEPDRNMEVHASTT